MQGAREDCPLANSIQSRCVWGFSYGSNTQKALACILELYCDRLAPLRASGLCRRVFAGITDEYSSMSSNSEAAGGTSDGGDGVAFFGTACRSTAAATGTIGAWDERDVAR